IYTEVRPFRPVVEKIVPVEVIVADEKKPEPSPSPTPSPDLSLLAKQPSPQDSSAAPAQQAPSPPQKPQSIPVNRREAAAQPPQQQPPAPPAPRPAAPAYTPPEPDLTVKYNVMLGLPEALEVSTAPPAGDKRGEGGDTGPASDNLASSMVDALRRHLKTCSKLPAGLSPSDNVAVKQRVRMTPDARL